MIKTRVGMEGFDLLVEQTVVIADRLRLHAAIVAIIANACNEVNQGKDSTVLRREALFSRGQFMAAPDKKLQNFRPPQTKYFPGPNIP